jgi:hypothetical protein
MEGRSASAQSAGPIDVLTRQRDEALARRQKTKQLAIADGAVKAAGSATP